ncbi:MAG: hypothetical protein HXX08_16365 [Chloroflexi bacterium]|uniref:Uncharacterized protein n=1 Tax=Candidatus Chlorohelix allophototropha TaxID=3003348 RepID=A0A8T7M5R6_9CHLR|nr:hypothetical protein [Chloroflexota bacterium]WJW69346.1 hypothetical protein OZ401_002954 [Chloroflexota bacterium L227-S17]
MVEKSKQSNIEPFSPADGLSESGETDLLPPYTSTGERGETVLACAMCKTPTPVEELTVTSKSRWSYETSLVVCPECLERMQLETDKQTPLGDLIMASVWGLIAFIITTTALGTLIWLNRSETFEVMWGYIGAYLLVIPGFVIGKAIYFGSGRHDSTAQLWIAMGYTALSLLITNYINQISFVNLALDIARPDGHALAYIDPLPYFTNYIIQPLFDLLANDPLVLLFVVIGTVLGLTVAYISSGGPRLYTRPFKGGR